MRLSTLLTHIFISSSFAVPITLHSALQLRDSLDDVTDTLLFSDTMDQFQAARDALDPPQLDWSSDGCTDASNDPLGFNFLDSCERHDFGYRNYKAQSRFTSDNKDRIDSNFKSDMYAVCATQSLLKTIECEGVADTYYEAVSVFGSKKRGEEVVGLHLTTK